MILSGTYSFQIKVATPHCNPGVSIIHTEQTGFGDDGIFSRAFHKVNSGTRFRSHTSCSELSFGKIASVRLIRSIALLLRSVGIDKYLGDICEDK